MAEKKIHIPSKKLKADGREVIKISPNAYNLLVDIANETGCSLRTVASQIIVQAIENDLIIYDREEEE